MAKFKIQKSATVNEYFDSTNVIGGTGGLTSITGTQIQPHVYIDEVGASSTTGSILRSKGRGKFLVTDGTYTGVCTLVNSGTLAAGQMYIQATKADTTHFYVARLTNKFVIDFSGNKYQWKFGTATATAVSITGA
jgi:hypothetical protein